MEPITVYEKPTCTTCRNLFALLTEKGVDFDKVDYHVLGLTRAQVEEILTKSGLSAHEILRKREPLYKELIADRDPSEDAVIDLIVEHPQLMERPVVVRGDRAVLARPIEKAHALFD